VGAGAGAGKPPAHSHPETLVGHDQILLGLIGNDGLITPTYLIYIKGLPLVAFNDQSIHINRCSPGRFPKSRLIGQISVDLLQTLQPFSLFRDERLTGNPTLQPFFFMKGIHKKSRRLRGRNLQSEFLQLPILAQKLKIIKTIPASGKDRDKGLYIIRLLVLAGTPLKWKMFLNQLRKTQGPGRFPSPREDPQTR